MPGIRQNIVLIVADDLGKHDVSVYPPASLPAPQLERLADGGVAFSAAHVVSPVCSTAARAVGAELPDDRVYDGIDLLPFLRGEAAGTPHEALFWRTGGGRAVRVGYLELVSDVRTGARVLFDLASDPFETTDRSFRESGRDFVFPL